jgi:hypothetical protein
MTDEQKRNLACELIVRSLPAIEKLAACIRESSRPATDAFDSAMSVLESITEMMADGPAPDDRWCREYFGLTGEHYVQTEYGWFHAAMNTREYTGEEPMEVFDEVNAP